MPLEQIIKIAINEGILLVIALLVFYTLYRYIMMKIELMRIEFNEQLKEKKFKVKGNITMFKNEENDKIFIDLNIDEVREASK